MINTTNKMKVIKSAFYAYVAPDGEIQLGLMAETRNECYSLVDLYASFGIGKSREMLKNDGFKIKKVNVNIVEYKKNSHAKRS